MKTDSLKTQVVFYFERECLNTVFAYFPYENYNEAGVLKTCYAHEGQHSACHPDYVKGLKTPKPEDYSGLYSELESIGYNLLILN